MLFMWMQRCRTYAVEIGFALGWVLALLIAYETQREFELFRASAAAGAFWILLQLLSAVRLSDRESERAIAEEVALSIPVPAGLEPADVPRFEAFRAQVASAIRAREADRRGVEYVEA